MARLLGFDQRSQRHVSLRLVQSKEILGWAGLLRGVPCETAIASTDVIAIVLPAEDFLSVLEKQPTFGEAFREHCSLSEVFELLSLELQRQADGTSNLKELTLQAWQDATVVNVPNGNKKTQDIAKELDADRVWLVSSGVWRLSHRQPLLCGKRSQIVKSRSPGRPLGRLPGTPRTPTRARPIKWHDRACCR